VAVVSEPAKIRVPTVELSSSIDMPLLWLNCLIASERLRTGQKGTVVR
jgi:hypothetical protein